MNAHFTLLWCFERIDALDSIRWHVHGWDADLPIIRKMLEEQSGLVVDDQDSVVALRNLLRAVAGDKRRPHQTMKN